MQHESPQERRPNPIGARYSKLPEDTPYTFTSWLSEIEKVKGWEPKDERTLAEEQEIVYIWLTNDEWDRLSPYWTTEVAA